MSQAAHGKSRVPMKWLFNICCEATCTCPPYDQVAEISSIEPMQLDYFSCWLRDLHSLMRRTVVDDVQPSCYYQ